MGNGALPNGPSYRAHPRLYRRVIRRDAIFWTLLEQQRTLLDFGVRWLSRLCRVGPGSFTLSLSQIPDLILSHHPARAIAPRLPPSAETSGSSRFDPVGPTQRR